MNKKEKIIIGVSASLVAMTLIVVTGLLIKKYRNRKKTLGTNTNEKNKIKTALFIGDSLTAYNNSYAEQLSSAIGFQYKKVAKVGISTNEMLSNLTNELDKNKYDYVFILGGYNNNYAYGNSDGSNISYKLDKTTDELSKMYQISKQKGSKVVAITPPSSANNSRYNSYRQQFHDKLNDWIMKSDADYKVNLYKLETGGTNKPLSSMTGTDGEHLTAYAHGLLAKEIQNKIS